MRIASSLSVSRSVHAGGETRKPRMVERIVTTIPGPGPPKSDATTTDAMNSVKYGALCKLNTCQVKRNPNTGSASARPYRSHAERISAGEMNLPTKRLTYGSGHAPIIQDGDRA